MNVIVIGGVAAGTKTAAKLMRQDRGAKVTVYTKSKDISYAGCGLPYYVGGSIETREELIVNTPEKYAGLTGVEVRTEMEAVAIDAAAKNVSFANGETVSYDKLVIATGAVPFVPEVAGVGLPGVFTMRTPDDAIGLRAYMENNHCRSAVVVGGGFIGLEIAENLLAKGLKVTVVDMADQVMPNLFDPEMAAYIRRRLQARRSALSPRPLWRRCWGMRRRRVSAPMWAPLRANWWCLPSVSVPPLLFWRSRAWR